MRSSLLKKRLGGVYLVIDPSMRQEILFKKLDEVLLAGIDVLQLWANWPPNFNKEKLIVEVCHRAHEHDVPVFINNEWELLNSLPLDGVHFDELPQDIEAIRCQVKRSFLTGLTCNNDLNDVAWANEHSFDYVSFCSMFPSSTSTSCDLVTFETVKKARETSSIPIFLAGGIDLDTVQKLSSLDFDGMALISGIMSAEHPAKAAKQYASALKALRQSTKLKTN